MKPELKWYKGVVDISTAKPFIKRSNIYIGCNDVEVSKRIAACNGRGNRYEGGFLVTNDALIGGVNPDFGFALDEFKRLTPSEHERLLAFVKKNQEVTDES